MSLIMDRLVRLNEFLHDEMSLKDAHEIRVRLTVEEAVELQRNKIWMTCRIYWVCRIIFKASHGVVKKPMYDSG